MTAKLSKVDQCRLCLEDQAVKCPIHLISECPALAWLSVAPDIEKALITSTTNKGPPARRAHTRGGGQDYIS